MYLAIKNSLKKRGLSDAEAKTSAARIYNSRRPEGAPPVTRYEDHERATKKPKSQDG